MILILGVGGMLGHRIWLQLKKDFPDKVFGSLRRPFNAYKRYGIFEETRIFSEIDVSDFSKVEGVLDKTKPKWIINAVGLTLRKPELRDLEKCFEINSLFPHRLKAWATKNSSKVIQLSTDCVFDGAKGNYTEDDAPSAKDSYGKSKYLGEISGRHALTLRFSAVGRELRERSELLEWFLSQRGGRIKGYANVMYSGLTTSRLAKEISRIIQHHSDLHGLYQISAKPISKLELLKLFNEAYRAGVNILPTEEPRSNKVLDSSRYQQSTGFRPPEWVEMIREFVNDDSLQYER